MKRNYNQPHSVVDAIETTYLLQTIPVSDKYSDGTQLAPSRQYAPSQKYK
ncbi:MAG: hypothetical protein IJ621_01785 [Paludibacteraceae bacterium]|nr:hypothetical protein [Paludibacteraceae bacterium]